MDLYLIWATDGHNAFWLVGAWDDDSIAENSEGYEDELATHQAMHGTDRISVVKAQIDFDAVVRTFDVPSVGSLEIAEV